MSNKGKKRENKNSKSENESEQKKQNANTRVNPPTVSKNQVLGVGTDSDYVANIELSKNDAALESDKAYREIAVDIKDASIKHLDNQFSEKNTIRLYFMVFFSLLLSVEYIVLVVMIFYGIDSTIVNPYMISIFVETLGVIGAMIGFVFDSKQETSIVQIITSILKNFQKFGNNDGK